MYVHEIRNFSSLAYVYVCMYVRTCSVLLEGEGALGFPPFPQNIEKVYIKVRDCLVGLTV